MDDPSLATERTALGWRRTGLAASALTGIVVRSSLGRLDAATATVVAAAGAVALAIVLVSLRRGTTIADGRASAALAVLILAVAALQAVVILAG